MNNSFPPVVPTPTENTDHDWTPHVSGNISWKVPWFTFLAKPVYLIPLFGCQRCSWHLSGPIGGLDLSADCICVEHGRCFQKTEMLNTVIRVFCGAGSVIFSHCFRYFAMPGPFVVVFGHRSGSRHMWGPSGGPDLPADCFYLAKNAKMKCWKASHAHLLKWRVTGTVYRQRMSHVTLTCYDIIIFFRPVRYR